MVIGSPARASNSPRQSARAAVLLELPTVQKMLPLVQHIVADLLAARGFEQVATHSMQTVVISQAAGRIKFFDQAESFAGSIYHPRRDGVVQRDHRIRLAAQSRFQGER